MTRIIYGFVFAFLVFSTVVESCLADEIRWKFAAGDQYAVIVTQSNTLKSVVNRKKVDVQIDLGIEMKWTVESVLNNGNAMIEQSFTRMNVKVAKTAKPDIVYDTASKNPPEKSAEHFAEVYNKLVGIQFKVEISPRGEIIGVVLDKKDIETIRAIPESMEARKLFEKRGLMQILNSGGFVLPEESIEKDFKWPVRKEQKMTFGTAQFESVFTYAGIMPESSIARFTFEAVTKLTDQPENPAEKPLSLKSQKQSGEIQFETLGGYLKSIQVKQEMKTEKPFREMTIETTSTLESKLVVQKL